MGWGDEIMVTGQARRLQLADPRPVAVRSKRGSARWHPIWDNNPRLAKPGTIVGAVQWLDNYSGHRPYLDYARFDNADRTRPYVFTAFRVEPGEIFLARHERAQFGSVARGRVVLEPNIKASASPNKDWGWARWEALAKRLRDLRPIQIGPQGTRVMRGVDFVRTEDVRQAAAVLSGAALLIAPEGGLHHAAAALGVRAVVIFGGFISPETTGYDAHANLFTGGKACGMRVPCAHCREAMARITVDEVEAYARVQLAKRDAA